MSARRLLLCLLMPGAAAFGQGTSVAPAVARPGGEALTSAQAAAARAEKDWMAQAQGLDAKLAPLLPCDASSKTSIQSVSKLSDARVAELMNYLRLQAAQAAEQTKGARALLQAEESRGLESVDERTDASLERSAIEAQIATLSISADSKPALGDAKSELAQINAIAVRRVELVSQNASARDRGLAGLRDLTAAYQAREAALKQEIDAFQSEATRWNTYYSLRLARDQAEGAAVGSGAADPARAPVRRAPNTTKGGKKKQ